MIEISYLISSRSDFYLGSFSVSSYHLVYTGVNCKFTYKHALTKWTATTSATDQRAFFTGIRTQATQITTLGIDADIDSNTGELVVTLYIDTDQLIETLSIGYFWWKTDTIGLTYNFFAPKSGSSAPYQMVGIN